MELAEVFRALRARRLLTGLVVLLAVGAALGVKAKSKSVPTGTATVQLLVDSPQSALADLQQDPAPLASRASVFAQLMTSGAVLNAIAHAAGVPADQVTAQGPYSGSGQTLDVPTPSEARGVQIVAAKPLYHLTFVAQTDLPIITASVEGPTPKSTGLLADNIFAGVQSWLAALQANGTIPANHRVTIRQLGDAQAGEVNSSSSTALAGVAAMAVLMLGLLFVVLLEKGFGGRKRDDEATRPRKGALRRKRDAGPKVPASEDLTTPFSPPAPVSLDRVRAIGPEVPAAADPRAPVTPPAPSSFDRVRATTPTELRAVADDGAGRPDAVELRPFAGALADRRRAVTEPRRTAE
jgi:hypothetical protein